MGYKAFASMNVAIIGRGKTSAVLAQGLALAGHEVLIGIKEDEKISFDYLVDEFDNIFITSIEDAAQEADVIIMSTAPEEVRERAYLLDDVRGKVIIDTSYMNINTSADYLNTLNAIKAITGSALVVKCFSAIGFEPPANFLSNESKNSIFVAGDSKKAKAMATLIARDLGFGDCHDYGGDDSVPLLDEMAICYHNLSLVSQKEKVAVKVTKR